MMTFMQQILVVLYVLLTSASSDKSQSRNDDYDPGKFVCPNQKDVTAQLDKILVRDVDILKSSYIFEGNGYVKESQEVHTEKKLAASSKIKRSSGQKIEIDIPNSNSTLDISSGYQSSNQSSSKTQDDFFNKIFRSSGDMLNTVSRKISETVEKVQSSKTKGTRLDELFQEKSQKLHGLVMKAFTVTASNVTRVAPVEVICKDETIEYATTIAYNNVHLYSKWAQNVGLANLTVSAPDNDLTFVFPVNIYKNKNGTSIEMKKGRLHMKTELIEDPSKEKGMFSEIARSGIKYLLPTLEKILKPIIETHLKEELTNTISVDETQQTQG